MHIRWPYVLKFVCVALAAAFVGFVAYIVIKGEMFVLWPNVMLFMPLAIIVALMGFIIYGLIKGFENTFPDD